MRERKFPEETIGFFHAQKSIPSEVTYEFQERKTQDTLSERRQRHEHVGQVADVPAVSFDGGQEAMADIETVDS